MPLQPGKHRAAIKGVGQTRQGHNLSVMSAQTFKKAVEEGLELLARRNGSEANPDINVWDALDPEDPRNQEAGEEGDEGGDEAAGLGRDIRPQV